MATRRHQVTTAFCVGLLLFFALGCLGSDGSTIATKRDSTEGGQPAPVPNPTLKFSLVNASHIEDPSFAYAIELKSYRVTAHGQVQRAEWTAPDSLQIVDFEEKSGPLTTKGTRSVAFSGIFEQTTPDSLEGTIEGELRLASNWLQTGKVPKTDGTGATVGYADYKLTHKYEMKGEFKGVVDAKGNFTGTGGFFRTVTNNGKEEMDGGQDFTVSGVILPGVSP